MKKILFLALAVAAISACVVPTKRGHHEGDPKSVSVTIVNGMPMPMPPASRAESNYAVIHNEAKTLLTGGTLFFFNSAGVVVGTHTVDPAQSTFTVSNVSGAATSVAMIANPPADLTEDKPGSLAEFRAAMMRISNQAVMSGATGGPVASPDAVQHIALLDLAGSGNEGANPLNPAAAPAPGETPTHTHTATINLVPAVSRIEIATGAIIVKGGTEGNVTNLRSFQLMGVYVNNYSPTFTLGFARAESLFGSTIVNGGHPDWSAAYKLLTNPAPSVYLYDDNSVSAITTTSGRGDLAYHVFPGSPTPDIIIRANQFIHTNNTVDTGTKYWLIDRFYKANADGTRGDMITIFEPGYVYRIGRIEVGDTFPTDDPYDTPATVQVTVTVAPWHVQNTYVEPN